MINPLCPHCGEWACGRGDVCQGVLVASELRLRREDAAHKDHDWREKELAKLLEGAPKAPMPPVCTCGDEPDHRHG